MGAYYIFGSIPRYKQNMLENKRLQLSGTDCGYIPKYHLFSGVNAYSYLRINST